MEAVPPPPVRTPTWILTYARRNVTIKVSPYVLPLEYIDDLHDKFDDLQITLEDIAGR